MMSNIDKVNEEENNDFGFFVGLDYHADDINDHNQNINHQESIDTKASLPTADSFKSIVSTTLVGRSVNSKIKHKNNYNDNDRILNEINLQIKTSQSQMMHAMKSLFNEVLEGQNKINHNINKLTQRVDSIEEKLRLTSSPCDDTTDLLRKVSYENAISVRNMRINCYL